jgi:hypothetical protein
MSMKLIGDPALFEFLNVGPTFLVMEILFVKSGVRLLVKVGAVMCYNRILSC